MKRVKRLICRWFGHEPWFFPGGWECQRCDYFDVRDLEAYDAWVTGVRF